MAEEQPQEIVADVEPVIEAVVEDAPELPSIEALAKELGHKPKDEWTGAPEDWRDPAEYIRAGQHGKLIKEVRGLNEKYERLAKTAAATTERMLREQEAEITARFEQAVDDGDKHAAAQATRDLRTLEAQRADVVTNPETEFKRDNPWYGAEEDATAYAASVSQRELAKGIPFADHKATVESAVRKRFPELFEAAPARRQPPQVAAPSSRTGTPIRREKGAADLSREVRAAGEDFVQMAKAKGWSYTIEDFAKTHFQESGTA